MFRALNHEGVAADCLFRTIEYVAGGRRMTSEQRMQVYTACAVAAVTMKGLRRGQ